MRGVVLNGFGLVWPSGVFMLLAHDWPCSCNRPTSRKLTGSGILDTRVSGADGWAMPLMIWSNSLGLTGKPLGSVGFIFSFPCLE